MELAEVAGADAGDAQLAIAALRDSTATASAIARGAVAAAELERARLRPTRTRRRPRARAAAPPARARRCRAARPASRASSPPTGSSRSGLALPWPAMSGAVPWQGWNRPCRSPMSADGAMPMPPTSAAARSDRMSPNMFSVTSTSKLPGLADEVERRRVDVVVARLDVRECARRARRRSCGRTPSTRNTLALSTQVTLPGRPRALAPLAPAGTRSRARARSRARVITIVSRASRSSSTTPLPREANRPSVDSRTTTRSMSRARGIGQRQRDAGNRARRPHAGIQLELDAQVELRRDLGAVGIADLGPAHRAEQDRVGARARPRASRRAARRRSPCSAARRPDARRSAKREPARRARAVRAAAASASITSTPMPSPGSTQMSIGRAWSWFRSRYIWCSR